MITGNIDFPPYSLHTEISPYSLNPLMMLCTIDDEIIKVLKFNFKEHYSEIVLQFIDAVFRTLWNLCLSLLLTKTL